MSDIDFTLPSSKEMRHRVGFASSLAIGHTVVFGGAAIVTQNPGFFTLTGAFILGANVLMNVGKRQIIACQKQEVQAARKREFQEAFNADFKL